MSGVTPHRRDAVAGWALLGMLVLAICAARGWTPAWPAGVCGWFAGVCLWYRARRAQRRQFLILIGIGLACALAAAALGEAPSPGRLLAQNHALLGLLAAVTFLRLVALPETAEGVARSPRGATGYLKTMFGLHLFGAVINLSALVIMGDRLHARAPLGRAQAVLLSRAFASAAFWSPFFAAMATALTYAPGASLGLLLLAGIPLAACALGLGLVEARQRDPERLREFRGYPLRLESLWMPAALAASVILAHHLLPDWSVLALISLLAPLLTVLTLLRRHGQRGALSRLGEHLNRSLADMYGELMLFLAAGVLGAGLIALGTVLRGDLPPLALSPPILSLALAVMVGLALVGVHPVVSIAAVTAVIGPQPDPTPVAVAFLAAWGIGASAGPISGIHLLIQGRYGIEGMTMMRWNLGYTAAMLLAAVVVVNFWPIWTISVGAL